jgi:hypothetical protein
MPLTLGACEEHALFMLASNRYTTDGERIDNIVGRIFYSAISYFICDRKACIPARQPMCANRRLVCLVKTEDLKKHKLTAN